MCTYEESIISKKEIDCEYRCPKLSATDENKKELSYRILRLADSTLGLEILNSAKGTVFKNPLSLNTLREYILELADIKYYKASDMFQPLFARINLLAGKLSVADNNNSGFLCAVLINLGLISKNRSGEYSVYQLIPEAINNLEKFLNIHTEK
ncbi:hypothetical protein NGC85_10355 [Acinetobacter sp. Z1]|uniref:hypothetical protein n=1 Tax=Acinetobacter sp. Z1 TaxID=2953738 RepID=UPI0020C8AEC1|nr:hypothetical protein [Acinetobacter sp. Z1]UTO18354.1 hypothetical protein NGC85_10355 [Acinetobacter sp. Z1]